VSSGTPDEHPGIRSVPTRVKLLIASQSLNNFTIRFFFIYLTAHLVQTGARCIALLYINFRHVKPKG